MQRLAVGLLQVRDGAEHGLARQDAAGVGEHCSERADAGRSRQIGGRARENFEWAQVPVDLGLEPAFET